MSNRTSSAPELVDAIGPILNGHHPGSCSAALVAILADVIACNMPEEKIESSIDLFARQLREMVALRRKEKGLQ